MGIYGAVEDVGLILGSSAGSILLGICGERNTLSFLIALIFFICRIVFLAVRRKESS